jgi:hypothetical protein
MVERDDAVKGGDDAVWDVFDDYGELGLVDFSNQIQERTE